LTLPPEMPDLIGLPEKEARARLAELGMAVEIRVTVPPRKKTSEEPLRVVRQRLLAPGRVELVLAAFPEGIRESV
jgi:beta-lactam-binding protein with PASTA domain